MRAEREIREKRRFVHQSTGKKTLPAGLAWHVPSKQMQSLFKISTTGSLFSYIGKSWYPTGLARNNGSSTAKIVRHRISWPPLRKPSPSQPKSHEDCDSLMPCGHSGPLHKYVTRADLSDEIINKLPNPVPTKSFPAAHVRYMGSNVWFHVFPTTAPNHISRQNNGWTICHVFTCKVAA